MANSNPSPKQPTTKDGALSMQIYAAMLGDEPRFEGPVSPAHPRLKMRVKLEARLEHTGSSPFFRTTLREHVERCAAYALRAIDEARERLQVARPKPIETLGEPSDTAVAKPIVLIGPASAKRHEPTDSRAA